MIGPPWRISTHERPFTWEGNYLADPLVKAPEEKEKNQRQEKDKDCVTDYYPQSPIYMASYEEDAQSLVNSLVPEPTPQRKERYRSGRREQDYRRQKRLNRDHRQRGQFGFGFGQFLLDITL